ncbi:MAG: nuclear transport factor 2 family protein [Paludibacter sp.]|nr:nuclear transport factor 2 family protein [Paludibacter sp.]
MAQTNNNNPAHRKQLVLDGFKKWADGTGSVFDLLDDNVVWTISGSAPLSKTYHSKKQLIDEVLAPLNERLSKKIVPSVRSTYVDGNTVIVIWDGSASRLDGSPYNVSYAWFMTFTGEKVVRVTAFLDTIDFKEVFEK